MNSITPFIPGAVVRGELFSDADILDLDQDVLQVEMPGGEIIDVGWYPSNDPDGEFRIVTYRDHWDNQIRDTVRTRSATVVADTLLQIAAEIRGPLAVSTLRSQPDTPRECLAPGS